MKNLFRWILFRAFERAGERLFGNWWERQAASARPTATKSVLFFSVEFNIMHYSFGVRARWLLRTLMMCLTECWWWLVWEWECVEFLTHDTAVLPCFDVLMHFTTWRFIFPCKKIRCSSQMIRSGVRRARMCRSVGGCVMTFRWCDTRILIISHILK